MTPDPVRAAEAAVVRITVFDRENGNGKPAAELARGTGFFLAPDGLVATARHVLDGGTAVRIQAMDGAERPVLGVAAFDRASDLVLLKVGGPPPPGLLKPAAAAVIRPGAPVAVVGPPAAPPGNRQTMKGAVTGRKSMPGSGAWLQLSLPLQPGISGAPVLEPDSGLVVGIASLAGETNPRLGFAIPAAALAALHEVADSAHPMSMEEWGRGEKQLERWQAVTREARYREVLDWLDRRRPEAVFPLLEALQAAAGQDENPLLLMQAGRASEMQGRLDAAAAFYGRAAARAGQDPLPWLEFARLARLQGRLTPEECRRITQRAVVAGAGNPLAWAALGAAWQEEGNPVEAARAFHHAAALNNSP